MIIYKENRRGHILKVIFHETLPKLSVSIKGKVYGESFYSLIYNGTNSGKAILCPKGMTINYNNDEIYVHKFHIGYSLTKVLLKKMNNTYSKFIYNYIKIMDIRPKKVSLDKLNSIIYIEDEQKIELNYMINPTYYKRVDLGLNILKNFKYLEKNNEMKEYYLFHGENLIKISNIYNR